MSGPDATSAEIGGQGAVVAAVLDTLDRDGWPAWLDESGRTPVFVGCGSSAHLATAGAALVRRVAVRRAHATTGSEAWLDPRSAFVATAPAGAVLLSRSGRTTETVLAQRAAIEAGLPTLAITANGEGDLARDATDARTFPPLAERSVVMTSSFTGMLAALMHLAVSVAGDEAVRRDLARVPGLLADLSPARAVAAELAREAGDGRFVFLGTGIHAAIAQEAKLKVSEMSQLRCDAYVTLDFRHGPISTVADDTTVIVSTSIETAALDAQLAADVVSHGGRAVLLGPVGDVAVPAGVRHVPTGGEVAEAVQPLLALPLVQWLAYATATLRGLDPDHPRHLSQVVELAA